MKKIIFSLAIVIACTSAKSQLANKKWIGTLQLDAVTTVLLDFKKDTVTAINTQSGETMETMIYSMKADTLSLKKITGQSDCYEIVGKYKIEAKDDAISFVLVDDACFNRSSVLDKTKWNQQK